MCLFKRAQDSETVVLAKVSRGETDGGISFSWREIGFSWCLKSFSWKRNDLFKHPTRYGSTATGII